MLDEFGTVDGQNRFHPIVIGLCDGAESGAVTSAIRASRKNRERSAWRLHVVHYTTTQNLVLLVVLQLVAVKKYAHCMARTADHMTPPSRAAAFDCCNEATQQRHGGGEAGVTMIQEEQEAGGAGVAQGVGWKLNRRRETKRKATIVSEKLRNTPAGGSRFHFVTEKLFIKFT